MKNITGEQIFWLIVLALLAVYRIITACLKHREIMKYGYSDESEESEEEK